MEHEEARRDDNVSGADGEEERTFLLLRMESTSPGGRRQGQRRRRRQTDLLDQVTWIAGRVSALSLTLVALSAVWLMIASAPTLRAHAPHVDQRELLETRTSTSTSPCLLFDSTPHSETIMTKSLLGVYCLTVATLLSREASKKASLGRASKASVCVLLADALFWGVSGIVFAQKALHSGLVPMTCYFAGISSVLYHSILDMILMSNAFVALLSFHVALPIVGFSCLQLRLLEWSCVLTLVPVFALPFHIVRRKSCWYTLLALLFSLVVLENTTTNHSSIWLLHSLITLSRHLDTSQKQS